MIVYRCLNKANGKSYIGVTSRGLDVRKYDHLNDARIGSSQHFHNAIRKYGKESFEWSILEECESWEELEKREIYYIEKFDSFNNGYNMTLGGLGSYGMKGERCHSSKITDIQALEIYKLLIEGKPFKEISKLVGVSFNTVSRINRGTTFNHLYDVPAYKIRPRQSENMTEETALEIIELLLSGKSIDDISDEMNVNKSTVQNIFYGNTWFHLYDKPPCEIVGLQKDKKISVEKAKEIIELIISTDLNMTQISNITGVKTGQIRSIYRGITFKYLYDKAPRDTRKERGNIK